MPVLNWITEYSLLDNPGVEFCVFDLETTGLNMRKDRILEMGAVRFSLFGGKSEAREWQTLVHPGIAVPPAATRINGIGDADLVGAPGIEGALSDFLEFSRGAVLAAHNAGFDAGFLNKALGRLERGYLEHPIMDTLLLAKKSFPGLPSYSLENLAKSLDLGQEKHHRALGDARMTQRLIEKAWRKRNPGGQQQLF